jgi:hypothetical protein
MQKHFYTIVRWIAVLFLITCCSVAYSANNLKSCPPNNVIHSIVNNVRTTFTDYEALKKVEVPTIPFTAKQQLLNTIAVYDNCDKESKMKFIAEFPNTFKQYLDIFQHKYSSQFDHAVGTILELLGFIAEEYPKQCVNLLVSLSSEAKYDADAPGTLQYIFTNFFIKNPDLTILKIKRLNIPKQENIASFLADVESIRTYQEYQNILDILKNRNETKLYDIFVEAKENKIEELKP